MFNDTFNNVSGLAYNMVLLTFEDIIMHSCQVYWNVKEGSRGDRGVVKSVCVIELPQGIIFKKNYVWEL